MIARGGSKGGLGGPGPPSSDFFRKMRKMKYSKLYSLSLHDIHLTYSEVLMQFNIVCCNGTKNDLEELFLGFDNGSFAGLEFKL